MRLCKLILNVGRGPQVTGAAEGGGWDVGSAFIFERDKFAEKGLGESSKTWREGEIFTSLEKRRAQF